MSQNTGSSSCAWESTQVDDLTQNVSHVELWEEKNKGTASRRKLSVKMHVYGPAVLVHVGTHNSKASTKAWRQSENTMPQYPEEERLLSTFLLLTCFVTL